MNITRIALVLLASLICVGCSDSPDPTGGGEMVVERHENGQLKSRGYQKGVNVRTGVWTFFVNGAVKVTGYQLEDGTRVGHWIHWHENGQKWKEGEYKNGQWTGIWTYWHENGKKCAEGEFKGGEYKGPWTFWYQNGQKRAEGEYKIYQREIIAGEMYLDTENGNWMYWNEDGSINTKKSGIYEHGNKIADLPKKK